METLSLLLFAFLSTLFLSFRDDDPQKYISVQYNVIVPSSACGAKGHTYFSSSHTSKTIKVYYQVNSIGSPPGNREVVVKPKENVQTGCTTSNGVTIVRAEFI
jgi:hypothetical protein